MLSARAAVEGEGVSGETRIVTSKEVVWTIAAFTSARACTVTVPAGERPRRATLTGSPMCIIVDSEERLRWRPLAEVIHKLSRA